MTNAFSPGSALPKANGCILWERFFGASQRAFKIFMRLRASKLSQAPRCNGCKQFPMKPEEFLML